jgi:Family of unknown function (DUF6404)
MHFETKLTAALELLSSTGIWRSNYAPPLLRFLWRLGVKVPPPHFVSFAGNFAFTGSYFGIIWGLAMWFVSWSHQGMPLERAFQTAIPADLIFGFLMASLYRHRARKHRIPLWRDFRPTNED